MAVNSPGRVRSGYSGGVAARQDLGVARYGQILVDDEPALLRGHGCPASARRRRASDLVSSWPCAATSVPV
jgi:hypothetical protein